MHRYPLAKAPILDETDIDIIRVLLRDCRMSYRGIGLSVGLSKNAAKARVDKLFSTGIIRKFAMSVNPAVFGYSSVCHIVVRDSKTLEETSSRLRLLGEIVIRLDCIGGISVFGVATKGQEGEKIPLLADALKPALVQTCVVGRYPPIRQKLGETDFQIMRCLMSDPRMAVSEIAKRVSVSSKTVSNRLAKMKERHALNFFVFTEPANMRGYVRFGMIIRLENDDGKSNYDNNQKSAVRVFEEELEKNFVMAFPVIIQEDVAVWQLMVRSIFDIDPAMKKIESLDGVKGAEVFIPFQMNLYQDWMQKEINGRIKKRPQHKPDDLSI